MRQGQYKQLTFGIIEEIGEFQMTLALLDIGAHLAAGEQLTQPAVSRAVTGIDQDVGRAVHEDDARADQQLRLVLDFRIVQLGEGAHHAGQRIVIGNADGGKA